LCKLSSKI